MDRSKNFLEFWLFAAGRLRICVDFWPIFGMVLLKAGGRRMGFRACGCYRYARGNGPSPSLDLVEREKHR